VSAGPSKVRVKEKSIEVKVGALVLVCTALLVGFVLVLGDVGGSSGFRIPVDFVTASDLKPGAPVKIAGTSAGKVAQVDYWGGKLDPKVGRRVTVRIWLDIDPEKGQTLHDDTQFYISTQGILGEKYIEIDPGQFDRPALKPEIARLGEPPLRMEVLGQQLTKVAGALTRLLEANEKVIGDVLTHTDQAVLEAKKAIGDADQVVLENRETVKRVLDRLDQTGTKIDKLVAALESSIGDGRQIKRTLASVERVAAKADEAAEPMLRDARQVTKNLRTLSEKLRDQPTVDVVLGDKGTGKVHQLLDRADGAMVRADKAIADVEAVTANARKGRGTIGGLLMDNELFMDMKLLLKDLKRHQWKFIWRE
jgi:phospholipid/cholesterol/gamma-HCH transport system substrate-binding protein